jgi:putative endonuclease
VSEVGRGERAKRSGVTGRRWEFAALLFLMAKGWRPLARRLGGKGGEIDLVMKRGRTIAFVEVKARRSLDDAAAAITAQKRRLVTARVRNWLSRNPWAMNGHDLRVDALYLAPWRRPLHVPAAFDLAL